MTLPIKGSATTLDVAAPRTDHEDANGQFEGLVALTVEAAAMARVPLAGTSWTRGTGRDRLGRVIGGSRSGPGGRGLVTGCAGGHAITVVTAGASLTGTTARSSRRCARADSGSTAQARRERDQLVELGDAIAPVVCPPLQRRMG
jgi:hypothetical protein